MPTHSQVPGNLNLTVKRGDDFSTVVILDTPLTGYTTSATIFSLVSGSEVTPMISSVTDATNGNVTLYLTDSQTSGINPGSYGWSLKWTASGGDVRHALGGVFEVVR